MSHPRDWNLDCKVYVGELGHGCPKHELEEKFSKYGTLKNVWVARRPAGFAFVEFDDPRDAEDAVRALDGTRINGRRVRVEMSTGRSRRGRGFGGPPPRGRPVYDEYRFSRSFTFPYTLWSPIPDSWIDWKKLMHNKGIELAHLV